ncbi:MAG TPA: HlyD family efflux transporter periplasmic adaptor subunit [Terracidiphilus sp.]|nr:HlyD family efflux transporter periplasmic adaptor subunit [Terracidiphilus sp.]
MSDERRWLAGRKWLWVLAALLVGASALPILYSVRAQRQASPPPVSSGGHANGVSCLGRIEPEGGVIHVAGAYISGQPPVVQSLKVKVGEQVRRGELLAVLAGQRQLEAALEQAQARTSVARRRLEQVEAGPKQPDLAAQQAEITLLQARLQNAQSELQRYDALHRTDDVTASELDARRTAVSVIQSELEQSTRRLESLKEVSGGDLHIAEAQLQAAIADEQRSRRDYELCSVYAPTDGQILKIEAQPGEEAGTKGILELGHTGQMYVVAEVYETDIVRVHTGQRATISGDLLAAPLSGVVEQIDPAVKAPSVVTGDPTSFSDNRIVEARIRLDQSQAVAGLIDGRVNVVIQP